MLKVTFHSYKGGAGRSSTALNTLPYLVDTLKANKKSPILVVDMDLDSAGMTYLLDVDADFKKDGVDDIKSLLKDEFNWSSSPDPNFEEGILYKKLIPVGNKIGVENEAVLFLGVNDKEKIDNNEMTGTKESVLQDLCKYCKNNNFSAIVIDSSTGDQFSAVLSIGVATVVVHCLRATRQFRIGSFHYLYRLKKENDLEKTIILLPTVVPNADRVIDGKAQRETAIDDILHRIGRLGLKNIKTNFINKDQLGINEVERFKWQEGVLYDLIKKNQKLEEDEKEAAKRYEKLAQLIAECE